MIFQLSKRTVRNSFNTAKISVKKILNLGSLPDFYIIGAQKSGTSSLYDCLCQHPGIIHRIQKEVHFFNNPARRCLGLSFYKAHFSTQNEKEKIASEIGYAPLEGDATPFMIHPWVPEWVHEATPNSKLILILRNPIDRALSHYYHNKSRGREILSFEAAVKDEDKRIKGDLEHLLSNPDHSAYTYLSFSYLARGHYANQLQHWLKFFPIDQIHVTSFENFVEDQQKTVSGIFKFLKLPDHEIHKVFKSNQGKYHRHLNNDLYQMLFEHFYPYNERLFKMINQDFGWNTAIKK